MLGQRGGRPLLVRHIGQVVAGLWLLNLIMALLEG
jgi:hypothetical protein